MGRRRDTSYKTNEHQAATDDCEKISKLRPRHKIYRYSILIKHLLHLIFTHFCLILLCQGAILQTLICDDVVGNPDLRAHRKKNLNKLIMAHLNVNSLRNKLEFLKEQIQDNIDILMISETKIDASFPIG